MNVDELKFKLSRAEDSLIKIPVPGGLSYLNFQKGAVEYSIYSKNVLLGDEPGLGKTIQAIAIMNYKGHEKVNIYAPSSLILNWQKELSKWFLNFGGVEIYHPNTFTGTADVLLISHYWLSFKQTLKDIRKRGKCDSQTFDEVHVLKNGAAEISKLCFAPNGFLSLTDQNICASGTPLEKEPLQMFYLIRALAPDVLGKMNRFSYGMKYCGGFQSPWGWDFSGASNLGELGRKLRTSVMVRRTKKQVLKELPEKVINVAYLEPNNKGLLRRMVLYDDLIIRKVIKVEVTEISALRRDLGVAKLQDSIDYIKTQLNSGRQKIVVFAHHKEVIVGLMQGLDKFNPLEISGRISKKKRDQAVDLFQTNKENRIIVVSIRAGGVGLTLTAADYFVMTEYDWVAGRNSQCWDRLHRIGQLFTVQGDILVYQDTLDERQLKKVLRDEENHKEFYEDDIDDFGVCA